MLQTGVEPETTPGYLAGSD